MKKDKKCKVIISVLIFILGTIGSIYFSVYLHVLLSKGEINTEVFKIQNSIKIIMDNQNAFKIFGCLELLILMGSIFQYFSNDKAYKSQLIKITPHITTPAPVGQKQFGSARWMTEREKDEAFDIFEIKKDDELINHLIRHGFDDMKEGDKNN